MHHIKKHELREIAGDGPDWRVSIVSPTHAPGAGGEQDPIRVKNLVRKARDELRQLGCEPEKTKKLLARAKEVAARFEQKQNGSKGIAVFTADEFSQTYRLPFAPPEISVVSKAFHLIPVLPAMHRLKPFHLLALSLNGFRLYKCDADSINEVELPDLREIAGDASKSAAGEKQLHFHTGSSAGGGEERSALFHGQGIPSAGQKDRLTHAFRRCDRVVCGYQDAREMPLVVAGVEYYLPLYREVSSHPNLLDQVVAGSPEPMTSAQLHSEACHVARLHFDEPRRKAAHRCEELLGTQRASDTLEAILPAAREGRVEVLFVNLRQHRWGADCVAVGRIEVHETRRPGDEDLLNCAARYSVLNGGQVFPLLSEQAPGAGDVAAVFRY